MYYFTLCKVLVILGCVAAGQALAKSKECEVLVVDEDNVTVNCSRRGIIDIPASWPEQLTAINKESQVRITLFNNSITDVTQFPDAPGARVAISLRANRIVEIRDDAFSNIERLFFLDLSNNRISVLITVTQYPAAPGTRVAISLRANRIVEIRDEAFSNIDRLFFLDLSNNRISGEVLRSEIFQGPYNDGVYANIALETLDLAHNEIHSLDRYLFQYTPNLTRLDLSDNPIEILDHVTILALSSATKLEVLNLSGTGIDDLPLDTFRGLVNLQMVDLSNNKFVTVPESLSLVGSTLKYLTFNNNPIVELNDDSFIGLSNLIELEVGENELLEEVKRSTFTPLKRLRVLHLCHNPNLRFISHLAFRGLKDRWTLKEVYLDDNNLSELSTDLMPWGQLEVLGMTHNDWLCNCDLANIVTKQEAGTKFKSGEIPYCAAPMRLAGEYITNITGFCPTFDSTSDSAKMKKFSFGNLRPKHILWSIFGVAMVALFGMLLGLLVNTLKTFYKTKVKSQPIKYININSDSSFA